MLYYIGYYNCDLIREEKRVVAAASENKMGYMVSAISDAYDGEFEIVSPAETKLERIIKGKKRKLGDRVSLKTFLSFSSKNKLIRMVGHILTRLSFFLYLLIKVGSNDHLIVYHSLTYMNLLKFIKKVKKCNLTIEAEELYSDVTGDEFLRKKEIDYLQIADSYVFITELLQKEVNMTKPALISHGTYKSMPDLGMKFDDGKIHAVYAGTFRQTKGGAYTAIAAAEYLDDSYVLEVLGGGSDKEINDIKNLIEDVSQKTSCRINHVGFKTGEDFNRYIQACHIGLSTQPIDAKFNGTSFPSKVLMYMSNGLKVVSVRIPAVETSRVGEYIYYYDSQSAADVADVIRAAATADEYDSRKVLDSLHSEFVDNLKELLQE